MASGGIGRARESHIDTCCGEAPIRRANAACMACAACRQRLSEYSPWVSSKSIARVVVAVFTVVNSS
jgi:cytidine deaminase